MTTQTAVPPISTLVEMTADDVSVRGVRIEEIAGSRMVLSPPPTAPVRPRVGDTVVLRWAAGQRGRYVVTGHVIEAPGGRLVVRLESEPGIEQHRRYVRGGGGEQVRLYRLGSGEQFAGWIRDISEGGLRAQFAALRVADGDWIRLTVQLDEDVIEVHGTALRITVQPPEAPGPAATRVELVAAFEADEPQAQIIRRYVLRQQLLARANVDD